MGEKRYKDNQGEKDKITEVDVETFNGRGLNRQMRLTKEKIKSYQDKQT